jgi:2-polyprenyl-3-methyl-5-hydroxy-6-metoxy-1,4-benzoquinol methylase
MKSYVHRANLLFSPFKTPGDFLGDPLDASLHDYECKTEPSWVDIGWQLPTAAQMQNEVFLEWARRIKVTAPMHRKHWEWAYILEVLQQHGMLNEGKRGLGFGVGTEQLTSVIASLGATIVATDLDLTSARNKGWVASNQHLVRASQLNESLICDPVAFSQRVIYRECNMNAIPDDLRQGQFDFLWSACAFEHLGSMEQGLCFVQRAMECLRPGGIAVHTTEFNLGSNNKTLALTNTVAFRKRDIEHLAITLLNAGHSIGKINFSGGKSTRDQVVDLPPYSATEHLKLLYHQHLLTSIGVFALHG